MGTTPTDIALAQAEVATLQGEVATHTATQQTAIENYNEAIDNDDAEAAAFWEAEADAAGQNLYSSESHLAHQQSVVNQLSTAYNSGLQRARTPTQQAVVSSTVYADAVDASRTTTIGNVQVGAATLTEEQLEVQRQIAIEDEERYQAAIDAVTQAEDAVRSNNLDRDPDLPDDFWDPKAEAGVGPEGEEDTGDDDIIVVRGEKLDNRVRIRPFMSLRDQIFTPGSILEPLEDTSGVLFPYTPTISFEQGVNYQVLSPTHANTDYHLYQNTPSVKFTIAGQFSAQTDEEAKYLMASMHFFRTVTKMRFGAQDANRGIAPPVCLLSGYGAHMFHDLPIIITSFNMEMPNNVDYVTVDIDGWQNMVPALTTITIQCVVQQTPRAHREDFNWDEFASGKLVSDTKGWI